MPREVQPHDLVHGTRYDIVCFPVVDDEVDGRAPVVTLTGKFVTRYIFGNEGIMGPGQPTMVDTQGGYRYIFESLRVKYQHGTPTTVREEIREFFVNRSETFATSFFRVPSIAPLNTMEGLMIRNPRRENVMVFSDEHIYHATEQLYLNTSAQHRPIRFYKESHTAPSRRHRGGNGITRSRRGRTTRRR